MMVFICALVPVMLSCVSLAVRFRNLRTRSLWALCSVTTTSLLLGALMLLGKTEPVEIFRLSESFRFILRLDGPGKVYLGIAAVLWPPAMLYAGEYMTHEKREGYFFIWYTVAYTPAILLGTASNLFSLYISYELLTLCTVPLVWHGRDAASERAAVRYLLFLIGGAWPVRRITNGSAHCACLAFWASGSKRRCCRCPVGCPRLPLHRLRLQPYCMR